MKINNFLNYFNPLAKTNSITNFRKTKKSNQVLIGLATFFSALITLPFGGLGGLATFRLLTKKCTVLPKEKSLKVAKKAQEILKPEERKVSKPLPPLTLSDAHKDSAIENPPKSPSGEDSLASSAAVIPPPPPIEKPSIKELPLSEARPDLKSPASDPLTKGIDYQEFSTKREDYEYQYFNRHIVQFLERTDLPVSLTSQIGRYLANYRASLKTESDQPLIYTPSNSRLEKWCVYYEEKYDISIKVIEQNELKEFVKKNISPPPTAPHTLGVIVVNREADFGHVMPLLIRFEETKGSVLLMDVLGPNGSELVQHVKRSIAKCPTQEYPFSVAESGEKKQVDMHSCRTGALVTLRNALLDIQNNPELITSLVNENKSKTFTTPATWGYTDQILETSLKTSLDHLPRSAKSKKGGFREAVNSHRNRHNEVVHFRHELKLYKGKIRGSWVPPQGNLPADVKVEEQRDDIINSLVAPEGVLPKDVKVEERGDYIIISWESDLKISTYMHRKGHKITNPD